MNALAKLPAPGLDEPPRQFLTFALAGETYAIAIDGVREIIEYQRPTPVPQMPAFIRGVINLRGAVVPVIDLANRFGGPASTTTRQSCVVILELRQGEHTQAIGALVDAVNEVIELAASAIGAAPSFGTRIRSQLLLGMARIGEGFVAVLDPQRVLSFDELSQLDDVRETEALPA